MVRLTRKQKKQLRPQARQPFRGNGERPSVFSYRASRVEQERQFDRSGSVFARQSERLLGRLRRLPVLLSLVAIVIALGYSTSLSTNAQLIVNGDQILLQGREAYEKRINEQLGDSLWNRSKLTINGGKLQDEIMQEFPEMQTVTVSTSILRHRPIVEVTLAKPAALLATPQATYVLDGNGRALFNAKDKSSLLTIDTLPVVTDQSGHEITLGKPALTEEQISYVRQLFLQAADKKLSVESMALQAGGGELQVKFAGLSYFVKFNFEADPRQSIGAFFSIKDRLQQENKGVGEYIDVRIPDRVFVK